MKDRRYMMREVKFTAWSKERFESNKERTRLRKEIDNLKKMAHTHTHTTLQSRFGSVIFTPASLKLYAQSTFFSILSENKLHYCESTIKKMKWMDSEKVCE